MAGYATRIDQMQGRQQCTGHDSYRKHPGRNHCQHESHADHGSAKAGNKLSVHRSANKLNDANAHDQQYDSIEAECSMRQHNKYYKNATKHWAEQADADMPKRGGVVYHGHSRLDVQIW